MHPTILAAAGLLGVDEVYAIGGAGAVGALAYGVPAIGLEPVQVITGPGNVFVAAAKRLVRGQVGIDSEEFAARVAAEVERMAGATAHAERVGVALDGAQSGIVLVDDLAAAAAVSNAYGPEHLSIQTADPDAVLARIDNAGAVFLGGHSPVSLGDYLAGSNHVLPTGGQSRFSSGLGAHTFLRPQQVIRYSEPALAEVADRIVALANAEDLPAHGDAVAERFRSS